MAHPGPADDIGGGGKPGGKWVNRWDEGLEADARSEQTHGPTPGVIGDFPAMRLSKPGDHQGGVETQIYFRDIRIQSTEIAARMTRHYWSNPLSAAEMTKAEPSPESRQ